MIYTYDGTFDGLLTAIYHHYYTKKAMAIYPSGEMQLSLLDPMTPVVTDEQSAQKVYDAILSQLGETTYWDIYHTFLSDDALKETYILRYLILAFKMGGKVNLLHAHQDTLPVRRLSKKVGFEKHRFLGLLRFSEVEGVLYAPFEPDHDILILLGEHFADRLAKERFVIHDVKRNQAIFSNQGDWFIGSFKLKEPITYSKEELAVQALWQTYFDAIAIESRKNLKLQQHFVPLKYRKHLIEF